MVLDHDDGHTTMILGPMLAHSPYAIVSLKTGLILTLVRGATTVTNVHELLIILIYCQSLIKESYGDS